MRDVKHYIHACMGKLIYNLDHKSYNSDHLMSLLILHNFKCEKV